MEPKTLTLLAKWLNLMEKDDLMYSDWKEIPSEERKIPWEKRNLLENDFSWGLCGFLFDLGDDSCFSWLAFLSLLLVFLFLLRLRTYVYVRSYSIVSFMNIFIYNNSTQSLRALLFRYSSTRSTWLIVARKPSGIFLLVVRLLRNLIDHWAAPAIRATP